MKNKRTLTKILWIIWLICVLLFIVALLGGGQGNGFYLPWQNFIFAITLPTGIIAFIAAIISWLLSSYKDIQRKLLKLLMIIGIPVILVAALWIRGKQKKDQPTISNPSSKVTCTRTEPYKLAPEFDRALSLIEQRESAYFPDKGNAVSWIRNCLDIEYAVTGEAEGMFYFDDTISSLDRLVIKVNPSYKETDDLLTALLLRHELNHAGSYVGLKKYGTTLPCIREEALAFRWQYQFYRSLTVEERKSIVSRLVYAEATNTKVNAQIQILDDLSVYYNQAVRECVSKPADEQFACYATSFTDKITKYVESNPFYQKECGL